MAFCILVDQLLMCIGATLNFLILGGVLGFYGGAMGVAAVFTASHL